jgi:beta-N-acetylhexosaminidase
LVRWLCVFALFQGTAPLSSALATGLSSKDLFTGDLSIELDDETISPILAKSDEVDQIYNRLSLDQKVGQLLMIGFRGHTIDQGLNQLIKDLHPGGLIVFGRNIKTAPQLLRLNRSMRELSIEKSTVPPLIAIDQEGGTVSRIKMSPPQPSALAIGRANSPEISEKVGYYTGRVLRAFGMNMNLAPVLDIADPNRPSFLGTRSFSSSAAAVSEMSLQYALGLERAGIISTLKHFPGHGNESIDPHFNVPVIQDDLKTLTETRLKPFKHLIEKHSPPALMVAHMALPNVDPLATAATYSQVLIKNLLRKKWNYDGLVITDDIDMQAAKTKNDSSTGGLGQAPQAILAGADLVMVAWNRKTQYQAFRDIKQAVQKGLISESQFSTSVKRVIATKIKYRAFERSTSASMDQVRLALRNPELKGVIDDVTKINIKQGMARATASTDSKPAKNPRVLKNSKILLFSKSDTFKKSFVNSSPKACCRPASVFSLEDLATFLNGNRNALAVVHISGRATANWVDRIASHLRKQVVLVNSNSPALILSPESYQKIVNVYTYHPQLGSLLASEFFSEDQMTTPEPGDHYGH